MNQHEKPAPPERRWDEALDPHAHQGPYRPPAALLDILARAAGANSYEAATTAVRHRAASAATELHEAGLDPRVIGLVAEPRVNELLGVAERSARSLRQRDRQFPEPVTRGRLWSEPDVVDYLAFKHETSPRPGALHSARVAQREQAQTRGARP
ncbi:hypothetical protein [Micrococcus luteus]|uniref:hypothetical protein n=1 Tax=Micrococcus luteus TaxID=1270 RepID=UPI003802C3C0